MTTGDSGPGLDELSFFYISSGRPAHDYQLKYFLVLVFLGGEGREGRREDGLYTVLKSYQTDGWTRDLVMVETWDVTGLQPNSLGSLVL